MNIELTIVIIALLGFFCQWVAWKVKLPAILFLLLAGILVGPGLDLLDPDQLFGDLLFPIVSLSVAIILFEGSLTLRIEQLRDIGSMVRRMVTLGALIAWMLTMVSVHYLVGFDWPIAAVFGALVVVTGPTVIVPMLRTVRPNARIANILRWEGIVIDPVGALLAVLVYEYLVSYAGGQALQHTMVVFLKSVGIGAGFGLVAALVLGHMLRNHWIPEYLQNLATTSFVLGTFVFANQVEHESGLLAVTVMGAVVTNMRGVHVEEILSFKESLTTALISMLFILLAARIDPAEILLLGWGAVILLAVIQLVIRPVTVWICGLGTDLSWREKTLIAWIGPRGIVAASVSAIFALRLEAQGYEEAAYLVPLTFIVIIGTVVLQSATAGPLARLLRVAEPASRGCLIVGANIVARTLGNALTRAGFPVLLTDSSWENVRMARLENLNTFYGSPVSEYADKNLDLVGLGRLLAVSPNRDLNALAELRYRPEFGRNNIFTLLTSHDAKTSDKHAIAENLRGEVLFGGDLTFNKFASLMNQGAKIRTTQLTPTYGYERLLADSGTQIYPLFAVDHEKALHLFSRSSRFQPDRGWTVISLDCSEVGKGTEPIRAGRMPTRES